VRCSVRGAGCQACRAEIRLGFSFRAVALLTLLLPVAWSATSTAWETTGYNDFLKGSLRGLELTADGIVQPGPAVKGTSVVDQPALWAAVLAPDGSIYLGTGHRGKVYRVASGGAVTLVWTAPQPEVFALCIGKDGALYAGSSPSGSIYRIENGKATELFHPPAKYIWALAAAPQGGLYAATGDQGRIYYVDASGKGEVYYETGQQHVTSLAIGPQGDLYAGSDPGGLLFQIAAQGKGTILFHSPLPEVHGLAIEADGTVYASALGGSLTTRNASQAAASASGSTAVVSESPTVVSVTAEEAAAPAQVGDLKPGSERGTATSTVTPLTAATTATTAEVSGVDKSAIYRINPDRTVETLRTSKDDNVFDLLLNGTKLLFSTDQQGRLYELEPDRRVTLVAELGDSEAVKLIRNGTELFAAQSAPAKLITLAASGAHAVAQYESAVHDAGSVARWGHISWRAQGGSIVVHTRTGNSPLPDATWSDWSEASSDAAGSVIKSPTARYIQWRADWPAGSAAELSSAAVSLLPQNTPPTVRSINVTTLSAAAAAKSSSATASAAAYSVTVTDSPDATAAAGSAASQAISKQNSTQMQIAWQADDADGDKLVFDLYFRGEGEKDWKLIRSQIYDYSLLLDPDVLADGRYWFKVVASDRPSNAREYAHETEFISAPVVVDNTPPVIVPGAVSRHDDRVEIDLAAEDKTSPVRRCEYAVDAGAWQPVEAVDGVTDSLKESFHVQLEKLKPGEHLIVFRVYDSAGNVGLSKVVVH
jgi:hypothetical protein